MSGREEKTDKAAESAGIAQALAELIEKNRAQAVELEALGRLVDAEIAASQEREAEQTARLGEVLGELAETVAAVEIEKRKRIEAEELAAELSAAAEVIRAALASFPTTARGKAAAHDAADVEIEALPKITDSVGEAAANDTANPARVDEGGATADTAVIMASTVSIQVTVSGNEASELEARAAQAGADSTADFAALLIREGLRRLKGGGGEGHAT